MPARHYENFPVASWLCPPALRPSVLALYRFARTADDLADEGDASPRQRREALLAYRADLRAAAAGAMPSQTWVTVFTPLAQTMRRHALPLQPFEDLLDAFEQDLTKQRYRDRADLLDYCRRSANPVGRLMLQLLGVGGEPAQACSDAICTSLQLINFWQDLRIDLGRQRLYLPESDCARHGVDGEALLAGARPAALRPLVLDLCGWARALMREGAPLARAVPGRAGWELRFVVQGGLRILERIEHLAGTTLDTRPTLAWHDVPVLAWRAVAMGQSLPSAAR